jgi:sporulation protein YlmC with PRC-barrel domain
MHVRLSTCLGAAVVDRSSGDALGALSGIFIHPDTGKVEGITVSVPSGMLGSCDVFCGSPDIAHWGAVIQVSGPDALAPLEDRVRFAPILAEKRTVLGQRIRTELGRGLGICRDVQFDTEKMKVEWLFPRTWLRWGIALPLSEVQ